MKYVNLSELELNKNYIFCWEDYENTFDHINAVVKRGGSKRILVDPDDEFYVFHLLYFVKDKECRLLVFDNVKEAYDWCRNANLSN